ncbi:PH domain-containing protein [Candidatus Parcubacteria bacterium]|nr:PH domain-containing protein [Candidatus Parcubacteria bacterium]
MLNLDLEHGESIILEVRKHWFVLLGIIFAVVFGVLIPIVLKFVVFKYNFLPLQDIFMEYEFLLKFFYYVWVLFLWVFFFIQWTKYFLDVWYVTQKRIIDVDQKAIFRREVSNLRFDKIQDISIEVSGVIATMLNFGDIRVQTAAEDSSEFFMKGVRNPEHVRKIIFSQHNFEVKTEL